MHPWNVALDWHRVGLYNNQPYLMISSLRPPFAPNVSYKVELVINRNIDLIYKSISCLDRVLTNSNNHRALEEGVTRESHGHSKN